MVKDAPGPRVVITQLHTAKIKGMFQPNGVPYLAKPQAAVAGKQQHGSDQDCVEIRDYQLKS